MKLEAAKEVLACNKANLSKSCIANPEQRFIFYFYWTIMQHLEFTYLKYQ
jgi:hypothetical protein